MLCCAASAALQEGQHEPVLRPTFATHHAAGGHEGLRKAAHGLHVGQELKQLLGCI